MTENTPQPHDGQPTERRVVRSDDPSLTPEANRMLTDELRQVVGADAVDVPAGAPDHRSERHATHSAATASIIAARLELVVALFVVAVAGGVAALAVSAWWVIVPLFALAVLGMLAVLGLQARATAEAEHVSPTVAARLEEEGVGEPDKVLTELVDELTPRPSHDPPAEPKRQG